MSQMRGKQSTQFERAVYILGAASVVGQKEGEGPLGSNFDKIEQDPMFGQKSWEEAESQMQVEAAKLALEKCGLKAEDIRMIFAGDLLAQSIASCFGLVDLNCPLYGLFGACSTMGEALSLGAMAVAGGYAKYVLSMTSSHFASAEKEFRFPLAYGNQRPLSATWTVTGSGACILSGTLPVPKIPEKTESLISEEGFVQITGLTTGKLIDFGLKDSLNMGGCMAPAACDTIYRNFCDFGRTPDDYDAIFTGDLGAVGKRILLDLLKEKGYDIESIYQDCGLLIFDGETQDTHSGGSGCGCSASVLAAYILPELAKGTWKKVLFVPTGALLSKTSFNEGDSIPGIAHAVVLEHVSKKDQKQ